MRTSGRLAVAGVLAVLCMAPTAGDIGGCGTEPTALDPTAFVVARKGQDCQRCQECGLGTLRCIRACDPAAPPETGLPSTCKPLQHDGEVCLRALQAASCDAYATYVDDVAPATPSECQFCAIPPPPGSIPGFAVDAGADVTVTGAPP